MLWDLASCKVRLSKPRIEPSITSQLQVEPDLQMAGVGLLGCQARARDGAWMTKLARTRVGRTAAHGPFRSPGDLVRCTQRCRVPRGARTRGGDREDAERASVRPDTDTGQRWRFFERLLAIAIARFCMEGRESPTMVARASKVAEAL